MNNTETFLNNQIWHELLENLCNASIVVEIDKTINHIEFRPIVRKM